MTKKIRLKIGVICCYAGFILNAVGFACSNNLLIIIGSVIFGAALGYVTEKHDVS